jgi:predicted nucleic acid-binding protein
MIYVDTSVIVSALTNESSTAACQRWLRAQRSGALGLSDWTVTEVYAAISIKVRMGKLPAADRARVIAEFDRFAMRNFLSFEVTKAVFRRAAQLCERVTSGLRASDSLHLAIVEQQGADLCTLDVRLAAAATAVGVRAVQPT